MPHLLLILLLQAAPPPLVDQFRAEPPSHFLRIEEAAGGALVRSESPPGAADTAFPPGEAGRLLIALTGLESGELGVGHRVRCDSTCWADGSHGDPNLIEALAVGCDSWFADAARRVAAREVADRAVRAGFSRAAEEEGGWACTTREWTSFWRKLGADRLGLRATTTATLLSAAGLCVSSPRGLARPLHDPDRRIRAVAGASGAGAWVTGTLRKGPEARWTFALFVPEGTVPLAVARAASLLDETLRRRERATAERGEPLAPFDEDR